LKLLNSLRQKKGLEPISLSSVQPFEDIHEKVYRDFRKFVDVQAIESEIGL